MRLAARLLITVLLDFPVPGGVMLSASVPKTSVLYSSARLLTVPLAGVVGFTFVDTKAPFEGACLQSAARRMTRGATFLQPDTYGGTGAPHVPLAGSAAYGKLLYGSMHAPSACADALCVARLSGEWQFMASALSRAPHFPLTALARWLGLRVSSKVPPASSSVPVPPGVTNLLLTLQRQTAHATTEYSYSFDDALWGARTLRQLVTGADGGQLSAGAELYVSVAEKSGGRA